MATRKPKPSRPPKKRPTSYRTSKKKGEPMGWDLVHSTAPNSETGSGARIIRKKATFCIAGAASKKKKK